MTTKSDQFRGLLLAALMVLSVFAVPMTASAAATGISLNNSSVEDGETVTATIDDDSSADGNVYVVVDANGDGFYNSSEQLVDAGNNDGGTVTADIGTSGLESGDYTVYAVELGSSPSDGEDVSGQASTTLTVSNSAPSVNSAIEFNPSGADDTSNVEIAFDEDISSVNSVTASVDGDQQDVSASIGSTSGRVVVTGLSDITPNQDLTVNINASDDVGNTFHDDVSVQVTSDTFSSGDNASAYEGAKVAYNAGSSDADILIEDTEGEHVFDGSTNENSHLHVFDTEGRSTDVDYEFMTGGQTTTFSLRAFDLTVDSSSKATVGQSFDVDFNANAGNRAITAHLVNSNDEAVATTTATLDGSGEGSASFTPSELGNYTVEIVDDNTGVTSTTDTISIEKPGEETVAFPSRNLDQRGDVVKIPVSLSNADSTQVKIGSDSTNFLVHGSVDDVDGDGEVTLLLNTYNASQNNSYGVSAAGEDDFTLNESADNEGVTGPLDTGTYDLEAIINTDAQAVSTFTIQPRSTDSASTLVTTSDNEFSGAEVLDSLAQRGDVAAGDTAIVAVKASGIYGLLQDGNVSNTDALELTIEESERPQNRNKRTISSDQIETVTDAENNTVYFVIDTSSVTTNEGNQPEAGQGYDVTFTVNGSSTLTSDDQSVSTEFDIVEPSVSIDTNDGETLALPMSENATVSGTSSLAPGTQLSVEIRSDNNEFLETNQPVVQSDGSWSTSYDLSKAENGTGLTVSVRSPVTAEADGVVVEDVTTETPTTETPTTEAPTTTATPTPTETDTPTKTDTTTEDTGGNGDSDGGVPGFGLAAALVALLAAALLAYRRD